jgi:hypothetical protein
MSNPFAGADIMIPDEYREHFDAYVQKKEGKAAQPVHQPFARNIDMWFFAICLAVKRGLSPASYSGKTYKAAEGVVLNSDPWRPTALTLLAIGETDDVSVVERPGEMLRIANGYALAGLPELLSVLGDRDGDTALDFLSESVESLLHKPRATL